MIPNPHINYYSPDRSPNHKVQNITSKSLSLKAFLPDSNRTIRPPVQLLKQPNFIPVSEGSGFSSPHGMQQGDYRTSKIRFLFFS